MRNSYCCALELPFKRTISNNPVIKQKIELALHIAQVDSNVLILGESGVGKDLFARLIYRANEHALKPFIEVNCGTVPENLLESEFFGYEPGAFTGALKEGKRGFFELAQGELYFSMRLGNYRLIYKQKFAELSRISRSSR